METYRGFTIDSETAWDEWRVLKGERTWYVAYSYDEAYEWIDSQFEQIRSAIISYGDY